MVRRNTERAPLLHAYYVNCSASLWHACGMMLAMLAGWLLSQLWGQIICVVVDLSVAAFFTGYLLWKGVRVICANFRSLIDLPLPEPDQIKILQVLARHYDAYTHLGQIFTRLSGGQRRIEIELSLSPDTTACQIEGLREQLRNELGKCFGRVEFQLLARCPSAPVGNS
jgi:divalent metal cation (Fe/Co/Zn/Cd) transporter